jgi:hypothetical protein
VSEAIPDESSPTRRALDEQIRRKGRQPLEPPQWIRDAVFPEEGELEEFLVELDRWRHPERH